MTTPTPRTCTCPAGESPEPCEMKYALTECRISRLERELAAAQERAQAAEARAEANEKDAERYQWLRGGEDVPAHSVRWGRWEINRWEGASGWRNLLCSELDAAVDQAMQEKAK
jgi:hypothetical protein